MKNKLSNVKFQKKKALGIHSIPNVDKMSSNILLIYQHWQRNNLWKISGYNNSIKITFKQKKLNLKFRHKKLNTKLSNSD